MNAARASLLALLVCWAASALALVAVAPLSGRVVDQTGTLSAGDIASLTQTLKDLETRKGSQIAVLIVPTTDGEAIEQFSLRVAEAWKIGRKKVDDGALLVIAKNDRRLRIEVGYGLEGALTDATTKRIIDEEITPKFKSGDFAGGVSAGVNRMLRVVDGEKLPTPEPEHWQSPGLLNYVNPLNPFVIVGVFIVGGILRIGRHLIEHRWRERRIFRPDVLAGIEAAIKASEATHSGQIRFVVEGALDGAPLFRNQPARERALDLFSRLRIWDTAHNNGVLIYLLLADRNVEIIADRGIDAKVGAAGWKKICAEMEADFIARNFERGVIRGIEAVSRELAKYFPPHAGEPNELPDAPVVI